MDNKKKDNEVRPQDKWDMRFTVRPNRDVAHLIRYNYELYRDDEILAGRKVSSLNEYICRIIQLGIESIEVAV